MERVLAFVVLMFLAAVPLFGQQPVFDSLLRALDRSEQNTTRRVDILNELADAHYDYNNEAGYGYATQALDLARELDYARGIRLSLTQVGYFYSIKGVYDRALEYYAESAAVDQSADDLAGYNLVMTGNVYRTLAEYDSALHYYDRAIEVLKKNEVPDRLAFAYKNAARLFALQWRNKEAEDFFKRALALYETSNDRFGIADTWFSLAEVRTNQADFAEAGSLVKKACAIVSEIKDEFLQVRCLLAQGDFHYRLGEYPEALKTYFQALGILETKDVPQMLSSLFADIGDVYRSLAQFDVAWQYYTQALQLSERIGIKYETAKIYTSMSIILRHQRKSDRAHDYLDQSLKLRTEIADQHGMSSSLNALGILYYHEKQYAKAIESINRSLAIRERIDYREGISSCLYNLSLVFAEQGQFPKALQLQVQALAIEESIGNKFNIAFSHNRLGSLYTRLGRYKQAELHLNRARAIGRETNSKASMMANHLNWSDYFEARKNPALAFRHYKQYSALHDSVHNDISAQKLAELQALYMMEKKDRQIELLSKEKMISQNEIALQRSQISRQYIIIASSVVCLLLVSLLAYKTHQYSKRIRQANREITEQKEEIQSQSEELIDANETIAEINKKLEEKIENRTLALSQAYKELDTFFYRSSHDFRRPLTTFLGLAEVAKVTVKDRNALELFDKVRETASNLDKMLVKLQSISDIGSQQLVYKEVSIKEIFETICDNFRDELARKNIKTSAEIRLQTTFVSYPAMVRIIIENLVENAIHFSGTHSPFIKLKATQEGKYVIIDIQDNGQGIGKEYQEQVFDMYFRGNERSKGNGLGLYIVKKAVDKLDGSVTMSSISHVGSTFTITLPNSQNDGRP